MQEGVAETCAGVLPVALVQDVFGKKAKGYAAPLSVGRIAYAEINKVVAGYADGCIASCFLASGVAPAGKKMKTGEVRNVQIRKKRSPKARNVEDLLAVEVERFGSRGNCL